MRIFTREGKTILKNSKVVYCNKCPCECVPKVIAATTLDPPYTASTWDLSPYLGEGIGTPGGVWRLIEVGDCNVHWSGSTIDSTGKLVGLSTPFGSTYHYKSYLQLQQGCKNPDHSISWPGSGCK